MSKALYQWAKTPEARKYFMSTHFWGAFANWGLPAAAIVDVATKDEKFISGPMTGALTAYSMVFMRFAWQVQPRNYLLFACHFTNASTQTVQGLRFINYNYLGGAERKAAATPAVDVPAVVAAVAGPKA